MKTNNAGGKGKERLKSSGKIKQKKSSSRIEAIPIAYLCRAPNTIGPRAIGAETSHTRSDSRNINL